MKISHEKISKVAIIAIALILICCIVSLVMLAINGFKLKPEKDSDDSERALPSRLTETPDYGQNYINNIIFLGDCTISPMRSAAVLRDGADSKQIWTGESDTLSLDYGISTATVVFPETNESLSISEAMARKLPDYVVITLGYDNGVAFCTEERFKDYYSMLITEIKKASPDTKIILQSVFPISDKKQKDGSGITNDKIDRANAWIEELALDMSVKYLDTSSILKDSKGNLLAIYDNGDGVTLNQSGYTAVLEYIRTHGYK